MIIYLLFYRLKIQRAKAPLLHPLVKKLMKFNCQQNHNILNSAKNKLFITQKLTETMLGKCSQFVNKLRRTF